LEVKEVKGKAKRKAPEIVLRESKPSAVILDIDEYRKILERLEDAENLKVFEKMKKKTFKFRRLKDFFKEHHPDELRLPKKVRKNYQNNPLYKMRGSFDGPKELSENHDRYLYSI
jgi:PHD/YefM family antitoxin component YafN of YafNO toxin-antitoxin module